jgi:UDP-N-acetyl-D-glucosamine dehydrogenase
MKVTVIGQGYVGLTVALSAANVGHQVIGLDLNENLIVDLSKGKSFVPGISSELLMKLINSEKYTPTVDFTRINDSEIIIIAVPTPLNSERKPELKYIEDASRLILENLEVNALIINESTSYPGTLRNYIKPILDKSVKLKFNYASAPERVDPGNQNWSLLNTPRVIAGIDQLATEKAIEFYSTFCKEVFRASSPEVAEAAKLFENTFRQVNIALVNEFSEISAKLGFSAHEAILAAATKPFGFMPFYPSIGVGGHCIPVDPSYLSFAAEQVGIEANFINLSNSINLSMPKRVTKRIQIELGGSLEDKRIQLAGIAYKPNVPDLRESPALILIRELENAGANVFWFDQFVLEYDHKKSIPLESDIDLGLIVTPHDGMDFSVWHNARTKVLDLSANSKNFGWPKFL